MDKDPNAVRVGDQYVLPPLPENVSASMAELVRGYWSGFTSQSEEGVEAWNETAAGLHEFAPQSIADLAAKMILAIHFRDPERAEDRLAISVPEAPIDRLALEMEIGCVDWMLEQARLGGRVPREDWDRSMSAFQTLEAEYRIAAPAYDTKSETSQVEDEAIDKMLGELCDARFALIRKPAPDLPALAWKLEYLLEEDATGVQPWSKGVVTPTRDDIRRLLTPSSVLADCIADRAEWERVEAEYRAAWALWDELPDDYSNEEGDAVSVVAWPALRKLIDTPAPDAAAMLVKMVAAWEGDRDITEDDKEALIADATRLVEQRGE